MISAPRVGFNPLPWFYIDGISNRAAAPPIDVIYREIHDAGFRAVHAEVPHGMSVSDYRVLLTDVGLEPAPGYFSAAFSNSAAMAAAVEAGKRAANEHAQLGLERIFIADGFGAPARAAIPAQGVDADAGRLRTIIDNLGTVAAAMTVDFASVLQALAGFDGWYVVEVDVPDQPTAKESARVSAEWVRAHFGLE